MTATDSNIRCGRPFAERPGRRFTPVLAIVLTTWAVACILSTAMLNQAPESAPAEASPSVDPSFVEPMPLTLQPIPPVRAKKDRLRPIQAESKYTKWIVQAASRHRVDPALIKAVIRAESSYNHRAVSKRGAVGLMQLMPKTAQALGVEDSFDPKLNIMGGAKYLRQLMDQFDGDIRLAVAAYNAGSRNVKQYQGVPPFKATRYYLDRVFRYYNFYKRQTKNDIGNV